MRVIALDPGKLTGWAAADVDDAGEWHDFEHGIMGEKEVVLWLADQQLHYQHSIDYRSPDGGWYRVADPEFDAIVYEDWVLYQKHAAEYIGSDMPYSQQIGQYRLIAWLSDTKIYKQGADRKNVALRQMRAFRPELATQVEDIMARAHKDAHDGDAILHLWGWTVDHYPVRRHI